MIAPRNPRRIAGRLAKAAGTALVVAVALAGAGLFLALGVLPRTGSHQTLTVLSGSMRPTIQPGSVVVVRRQALQDVRPGDVLTFEAPIDGRPTVTHRVVEVVRPGDRPLVRTKGDANADVDPWVAELGPGTAWQVVTSVPVAGHAIHAAQTPTGRRVTRFGVPALFLVVWMATLVGGDDGDEDDDRAADPSILARSPA